MYKLHYMSEKDFPYQKLPDGGSLWNTAFPNMEIITASEFLQKMNDLQLEYMDYRQILFGLPTGVTGMVQAMGYWERDMTGIAICRKMDGTTFYARFATCEHSLKHHSPARFEHHYTCTKCGYHVVHDSSG